MTEIGTDTSNKCVKNTKMKQTTTIEIVSYQPEYAPYFEQYNREWIEENYVLEALDLYLLQHPEQSILKDGGEIFFARYNGAIIGTVAMKKKNDEEYELSKMAVSSKIRGIGAGKLLCEVVIERARELGAKKVFLYSNTIQSVAIKLYRKLGFIEIPVEAGVYDRANIKMELPLEDSISKEEITALLDSYGNAYQKIKTAVDELPKEMWQWQPPYNKWTIHQNIIHLADSEAHSYCRFRSLIAEPRNTVLGYNQDVWVAKLLYHHQNTEDALELYRLLRKMTYELLQQIPDSCWFHTIEHSEYGTMKMWQWLRYAKNHTHIFQMQRVYKEWKKQTKM